MPIGVPRVPFRTPKEGLWTWVDIWNCLYRERIIFVGQGLTDEFANQLVSTMLFLDSENQKDITLYVNCPGGDVVPTLSIHDAMRHLGSDVGTIAFGGAYAMGGFLLASGTKGKRMALPNTLIMLHSPSGTARGQASDIMNESKELIRVRAYLAERLGDCTGHTMEQTATHSPGSEGATSEALKGRKLAVFGCLFVQMTWCIAAIGTAVGTEELGNARWIYSTRQSL